jgi:hypothetical protein
MASCHPITRARSALSTMPANFNPCTLDRRFSIIDNISYSLGDAVCLSFSLSTCSDYRIVDRMAFMENLTHLRSEILL